MRFRARNTLASASLLVVAFAATAQPDTTSGAPDVGFELEEIVVTARRKDESIQDVPTVINAVTGAEIEKLNIRKFEDIASVIPGLKMANNANGQGATASVRGVNYDVNASGNNGTIEFYLNDAPISAGNLFKTMYDVQQVELLRGPQGTLRGRASPSGSMTVATRRPDLQEMGGYVSATGTNIGGYNGQGAFNFPIISDMLAIRVAGVYDKDEGDRVRSINSSIDPSSKTKSGRATVRFEPTDSLSFILTAQKTRQDVVSFSQVESQQEVDPNAPVAAGPTGSAVPVPVYIAAGDRLAVQDTPRIIEQNFNNYNLQAQWAFVGQKLNYVVARNEQHTISGGAGDITDYFPSNYPAFLQGAWGQISDSRGYATAHELRVSSEERIAGMFDYIVGAFTQKANFPTSLVSKTAVLFGAPSPTVGGLIRNTPITRSGGNKETSGFANVTAHFPTDTELSVGARYIKYHSEGALFISGARQLLADEDVDFHKIIYAASLKQNFTDDLMAYVSTGTSWRPGITAVGDFNLQRSPLENSFLTLPPEESTSYELGMKGSAFEKRLRYGASVYHQKYDNYPYRSATGIYYASTTATGTSAATFGFVGAVPVEVNGVEAEVSFAPLSVWDVGATAAYAKGKIKNGFVPCNDYSPRDGVPDGPATAPTFAEIVAATGGGTVSGCTVSQRASAAPLVSGTVQSEFRMPLTPALTGFTRGLLQFNGSSQNDPTNVVDDYDSYALLNLYLGVRSQGGTWEVSVYGKNVTNTERVLGRVSTPASTSYNVGATGTRGVTNYYNGADSGPFMTPPREFGLSARYAFGSK